MSRYREPYFKCPICRGKAVVVEWASGQVEHGTYVSEGYAKGRCPTCRVDFTGPPKFWVRPVKVLTKKQAWRRVTRLAGELVFGDPGMGAFSVSCFQESCLAMRELVKETRQWAIDIGPCKESRRCERRIAKLEAALAAWEEAK